MNSGANPANPIVQAANAVGNAASSAVDAVNGAANNLFKNIGQGASKAVEAVNGAVNGAANAAAKVATGAVNAVGSSVNSLIPFGNAPPVASNTMNRSRANSAANGAGANGKQNANAGFNLFGTPNNGKAANAGANNAGANAGKGMGNSLFGAAPNATLSNVSGAMNGAVNAVNAAAAAAGTSLGAPSPWAWPLGIFIGLVLMFLVMFSVFNRQIKQGYEYIASAIKQALGLPSKPEVSAGIAPSDGTVQEITVAPEAPQTITPSQGASTQSIVEKVLPSSASAEVFNVSKNDYTFYDAEPLCKALGAELATYEQVKKAWERGADWCNYGWVKGQMAVYPTQKETYDKLQAGPEDQRQACGTVGLNGGTFENPEMRFGVNCYGKKPSQSAHDEKKLMEEGKVPRSPETLKVDELTNKFKSEADTVFITPFNSAKWSTL